MARNARGESEASQKARTAEMQLPSAGPKQKTSCAGAARNEAVYLPALDDGGIKPEDDNQRDQSWKVLDADSQPYDNPGQQRPTAQEQVQG